MADNPITRKEKYLAKLTGSYTGNVPDPITRVEKYLYDLCQKGISGLTPEEIENAVNKYLKENPVQPGATTEQAQQIKQNTDDVALLKEDLSNKITKFYASSQGEPHLADSDNGQIMDMMVYGKSKQKQYSGNNLFKATLGNVTVNGITCTANSDGTYILNGTCTVDTSFSKIGIFDHILNEPLYLTGVPSGCGSYLALVRYDGNNILVTNGGNTKIDAGIHTKHIEFWITKGTTLNNVIFKPMITTDLTATYDDFEPYTGGIPSPNPDYPQEIKSVVNPTVKVCGKNLLNPTLFKDYLLTMHGVTCKSVTDETGSYFLLDGTADSETDFWILGNTVFTYDGSADKLTISVREACPDSYYLCVGILERDFRNTKAVTTSLKSFSLYIHVLKGAVINNYRIYVQVEVGDIATDYEPYTEQTVTLPYTLNAIPVNSGGNVTIDGQQYIADYVDVERGKVVKRVKVLNISNLDKSKWGFRTDTSGVIWHSTRYYGTSSMLDFDTNINAMSNIAIYGGIGHDAQGTFRLVDAKTYLYQFNLDKTKFDKVQDFTDYLASNNVYIQYALKVPQELDLKPEEIVLFKSLSANYPTTNISINSEQLDGYTVFNYPISMQNGWNYVKQQIGDTRDYIYDMDARTQDTDLQAAEAYVNSEYAVALTELEV